MTDKELLEKLENYVRERDLNIADVLREMHIAPSSYYRWKQGYCISAKKRLAIRVYTHNTASTNAVPCCPISECPAKKPDRFLQALLENWNNLTILQRAQISARAVEYANNLKNGENK